MVERRVRHAEQGEVPAISEADDFPRSILRSVVRRARRVGRGRGEGDELGIRLAQNVNGRQAEIWKGPVNSLEYEWREGHGLFVRIKDTAATELHNHPLRDGAILTGAALLGATFYIVSKTKKK